MFGLESGGFEKDYMGRERIELIEKRLGKWK